MDSAPENGQNEIEKLSRKIPALSDYAASLESHVKLRYLQKISAVGVDPASIPCDQFGPECLPPIEQSDLFSYLVLQTSFYTNDQFKNYKSLEAYNQVVSGFVASVQGKVISGKYVVVAKVRHSQRMNDPLVNVWIIAATDGTILLAHCLGCQAGLAPVQQQTNDSDCGVFAIAFPVSLALGTDPMHVTFDIRRMRLHLAACLEDKKLNMFPVF